MSDARQSSATPTTGKPEGVLYDQGYRRYVGPRVGRASAVLALFTYSLRRAVGIGKRWTAKILPAFLYLVAFGPVLAVIALRAILGQETGEGTGYGDIFGILTLVVLIFGATAGPEMLCDDRRQGVLPVYFSRVITRGDYLLAKLAALAVLLLSVALLPLLLLFIGNVLLDGDPLAYFRQHAGDLGRIVALSGLVTAYYAALVLAIAANVERKGIAAAIFVGVILLGTGLIEAVRQAIDTSWRNYVTLLSPGVLADALTGWFFPPMETSGPAPINGAWYLLSILGVVAISGMLLYRRYLRED